jgi:putative phosphoribosyl transferase
LFVPVGSGYIPGMRQGEYALPFPDRRTAGTLLAERLGHAATLAGWAGPIVVLALPRGGVAVARQVAAGLNAPMGVIVTRKIGYPRQPEVGVGAIAEGLAAVVYDDGLLTRLSLSPSDLAPVVAAERAELNRRVQVYRAGRPLPQVAGCCVIVVDDGLATGVTARAALRSLRAAQAAYLVLAAPVAAPDAAQEMCSEADRVVILAMPRRFRSVGQYYRSFGQLTDDDVLALLT